MDALVWQVCPWLLVAGAVLEAGLVVRDYLTPVPALVRVQQLAWLHGVITYQVQGEFMVRDYSTMLKQDAPVSVVMFNKRSTIRYAKGGVGGVVEMTLQRSNDEWRPNFFELVRCQGHFAAILRSCLSAPLHALSIFLLPLWCVCPQMAAPLLGIAHILRDIAVGFVLLAGALINVIVGMLLFQ